MSRREEIRDALAAASTWPWKAVEQYSWESRVLDADGGDIARGCSCDYATLSAEDAHLIANAPAWLSELLAENERLMILGGQS